MAHTKEGFLSLSLALALSLSLSLSDEELLLASCAQDCLIRMWRLRAGAGGDARPEDNHTVIRMKEEVFEVEERGEWPRGGYSQGAGNQPAEELCSSFGFIGVCVCVCVNL